MGVVASRRGTKEAEVRYREVKAGPGDERRPAIHVTKNRESTPSTQSQIEGGTRNQPGGRGRHAIDPFDHVAAARRSRFRAGPGPPSRWSRTQWIASATRVACRRSTSRESW